MTNDAGEPLVPLAPAIVHIVGVFRSVVDRTWLLEVGGYDRQVSDMMNTPCINIMLTFNLGI
jgi:hypothetical protein